MTEIILFRFTPLQTYKVLKRLNSIQKSIIRFTPLQTYKVLKLLNRYNPVHPRFTPLQTYKVLKHYKSNQRTD